MPRPKNKKPSPELKAVMDILQGLAKEDGILVWIDHSVRTVKHVRFGHNSKREPAAIILDV